MIETNMRDQRPVEARRGQRPAQLRDQGICVHGLSGSHVKGGPEIAPLESLSSLPGQNQDQDVPVVLRQVVLYLLYHFN